MKRASGLKASRPQGPRSDVQRILKILRIDRRRADYSRNIIGYCAQVLKSPGVGGVLVCYRT